MSNKILIHLTAIGNANILKKKKYYINKDKQFKHIYNFLKEKLYIFNHHLFMFIKDTNDNNFYHPKDNEIIKDLYDKFNINNEILIRYSYYSIPKDWCNECHWQVCKCKNNNQLNKIIKNDIDYYSVNLKILGSLKLNEKLIKSDTYFGIDNNDYLQSIRRTILGRSHIYITKEIKIFMNTSLRILDYILNNISEFNNNEKIYSFLKIFKKVNIGFMNLKNTYNHDLNFCLLIENIISKIDFRIRKLNRIL